MDHTIGTISAAKIAELSKDVVLDLVTQYPRISQALWWASLVDEAVAREWIINNSQRDAAERMVHLLCEIFLRLRAVGLTNGNACEIPVTQAELADRKSVV